MHVNGLLAESVCYPASLPAGHTGQKFGTMKGKRIETDIIYITVFRRYQSVNFLYNQSSYRKISPRIFYSNLVLRLF